MDPIGLIGLFVALSARGDSAPGTGPPARRRKRPAGGATPAVAPAPAPWPQALPGGLPAFPGAGWTYDEPPPLEVQQRAGQLVDQLWAQGSGAYRVEQTAGRWIAYRAEIVASGKKGVVAYRLRPTAAEREPAISRAPPPAPAPERQGETVIEPPLVVKAKPPPPQWNVQTGPATVYSDAVAPEHRAPPATPPSELALPTLRMGAGMPPAQPLDTVRLLQQHLGVAIDGRFGTDTLAAVKTFQARHGLASDGVVGKKTWTALFV